MNRYSKVAMSVLLGLAAGTAHADSCTCEALQERVQRLEQRLAEMERLLAADAAGPDSAAPAASAVRSSREEPEAAPAAYPSKPAVRVEPASATIEPADRGAPSVTATHNAADVRYWILKDQGSLQPTAEPDAKGRIPFDGTLSFHPHSYDVGRDGWFSSFDDPSLYQAAAVALSGTLEIPEAGRYELVVTPKPAREGGSSVRSSLEYRISIGGVEVVPATETRSWSAERRTLHLEPGTHRVEVHALARSPGFGPSPTDSTLGIDLRGPRDAAPRPMVLSAERY